jgi:hypothetical protein
MMIEGDAGPDGTRLLAGRMRGPQPWLERLGALLTRESDPKYTTSLRHRAVAQPGCSLKPQP